MARKAQSCIVDELRKLSSDALADLWHKSAGGRTGFYLSDLVDSLEKSLSCDWAERELQRYDLVMGLNFTDAETGYQFRGPKVFLESENNPFTAHIEIERLACATAPLRILLTLAEWSPSQFPVSHKRQEFRQQWDGLLESYNKSLRNWGIAKNGVILVMIGECGADSMLRFYAYEYREASNEFFPSRTEETVYEIGYARGL